MHNKHGKKNKIVINKADLKKNPALHLTLNQSTQPSLLEWPQSRQLGHQEKHPNFRCFSWCPISNDVALQSKVLVIQTWDQMRTDHECKMKLLLSSCKETREFHSLNHNSITLHNWEHWSLGSVAMWSRSFLSDSSIAAFAASFVDSA